ncbi:MAG: hypothetical protein WCA81_04880 [Rhizomicrobium sp.]
MRGANGSDITYDAAGERATMTDATSAESYTYTADGYLAQTTIGGTVRAEYTRDAMGRVTDYKEYDQNGPNATHSNPVYERSVTLYDNAYQVQSDKVTSVIYNSSTHTYDTNVTSTSYFYGANGGGAVTNSTADEQVYKAFHNQR